MLYPTKSGPTLPPDHAFVVQLHAGTQIEARQISGRVEHLVSRQAISFQTLDALLAFMTQVLRGVRAPDRVPEPAAAPRDRRGAARQTRHPSG